MGWYRKLMDGVRGKPTFLRPFPEMSESKPEINWSPTQKKKPTADELARLHRAADDSRERLSARKRRTFKVVSAKDRIKAAESFQK